MRIIIYIMKQDFSKGKIYKISNDYNDDVYIGMTCDELQKRFSYHKADATRKDTTSLLYKLMKEIGFDRFRIDLVENYPCIDRQALCQREGHWIRQMGTLNKYISGRTHKEYADEHKEHKQEYNKNYREEHLEQIKEKQKEYYEKNLEIIKQKDKERHKLYYEKNKEKINEKHKIYIEKNKEAIKEKITCECGVICGKSWIARHKKSAFHQAFIANQQQQ